VTIESSTTGTGIYFTDLRPYNIALILYSEQVTTEAVTTESPTTEQVTTEAITTG
jgi:hypothetical protein